MTPSARSAQACAILEAIEELNRRDEKLQLQVRVGINTGEAVVALGAHPERGEGFRDRRRGQHRLPPAGHRPPSTEWRYRSQPFARPSASSPLFASSRCRSKARRTHSRSGSRSPPEPASAPTFIRTSATPLVGREFERQQLIAHLRARRNAAFLPAGDRGGRARGGQDPPRHRALAVRRATPGAGCAGARAGVSRTGRGSPSGPWGRLVKGGKRQSSSRDSPEEALAKLDQAIPEQETDRAWLKARLAPLVGAGGEPAAQEESFTAWRRFLDGLAAQNPTVLVVDDLALGGRADARLSRASG